MALALRSAAKTPPSDPTESLKLALKGFENALTSDRKQLYQKACAKPNATSVVTFVTQLDQDNDGRAHRCFAPRLLTFLNATRQFSDAVDTFVSSNPHIAGLVWGGIKTAILAASNFVSYFEKITELIMRIGRFCPVYDNFDSLHPGAVGLQAALCKFYATIIEMCTKVILGSQKSLWQQVLSPIAIPFEAEFKPFVDQLERDEREVELQILLASQQADRETARLLELNRQQSASNWKALFQDQTQLIKERELTMQWRGRQRAREETKVRCLIRDNLSSIEHDKLWKQAFKKRISSTAEWFAVDPNFVRWKEGQKTAFIWCSGNLGTGKSILVSNIIAHLSMDSTLSKIVAHFLCRFDNAKSTEARNILGSISRQLLKDYVDSTKGDKLDTLLAETRDLDLDDIPTFISTRLEADKSYYILLDGLDECEPSERRSLAKALAQLAKQHTMSLKILCAARPDTEKELSTIIPPDFRLTLTPEKTNPDIAKYIEATLIDCIEDERLRLNDVTLIGTISEALQKGARGMFLWTRLMIEEICDQPSDNAIRRALKDLPRQLSDIFDRKLARIAETTRSKLCIRLLQICGVAKRPLTLEESREALSIELGQKYLDRGNLPNDIEGIVASCHGLVFIDEEDFTIHYVHHSVKQTLFESRSPGSARFDRAAIDKKFGLLCMTYLNFRELHGQIAKVERPVPVDPIAIGRVAFDGKSDIASRLARHILKQKQKPPSVGPNDLKRTLQELTFSAESSMAPLNFRFLSYAKQNWIFHLPQLKASDGEDSWSLFGDCIAGKVREADRPWETYPDHGLRSNLTSWSEESPVVFWAIFHDHPALLSRPLRRLYDEGTFLWLTTRTEFEEEHRQMLVNIIISNALSFENDISVSVLNMAIVNGSLKLVELCLEAGVDPNFAVSCRTYNMDYGDMYTPLRIAASQGRSEIVELLLKYGADVNFDAQGNHGRTPLHAAAKEGHMDVLERLLRAGANVNHDLCAERGRTALQAAAEKGHINVVERLLRAGANVNHDPCEEWGRTALQGASINGHIKIVSRLLEAGADVNQNSGKMSGRTALQAAARGGHIDVVRKLLEAGADVNQNPSKECGRTALQAAAEFGHVDVVRRLLQAGAHVNAPPALGSGITAIEAATKGGFTKIEKLLLAAERKQSKAEKPQAEFRD